MLNNFTKTMNFSANSTIEGEDGAVYIVLYMNASIGRDGDININQSIKNHSLYVQNQTQVEKDFEEFRNEVIKNASC